MSGRYTYSGRYVNWISIICPVGTFIPVGTTIQDLRVQGYNQHKEGPFFGGEGGVTSTRVEALTWNSAGGALIPIISEVGGQFALFIEASLHIVKDKGTCGWGVLTHIDGVGECAYYLVWYTDLGIRGVFQHLTSLLF